MSVLLIAPNRDVNTWKDALLEEDPNLDVEVWPDVDNKERVQFIVSWNQPKHTFSQFPNLKVISSSGAGVDHILRDEDLPEGVKVCRSISPRLARQMQEYVLAAVLNYQRNMFTYFRQRTRREWTEQPNIPADDIPIGIMGLGKLGEPVAEMLNRSGYSVNGWSRTKKEIEGVTTFTENELNNFLEASRILVCLLPLTADTEGILDLQLLKKLKRPGFLVNVGRGEHLVDEDLIYAMDTGWIEGACLDVFSEEPLPDRHPFWNRENIIITPHAASFTPPQELAEQVVENYKRVLSGIELINEVSRNKGY